jgi:hypothetical protein
MHTAVSLQNYDYLIENQKKSLIFAR